MSHGSTWLGALAPFPVATPWWADVEPVTSRLDALLATPTTVLRLVDVVGGRPPAGGLVTYHVELSAPPSLDPGWQQIDPDEAAAIAAPHPRRTRHAVPGGPGEHLRWAETALAAIGRPRTGTAVQVKTWNLSCVYRIPTANGPVWLKGISGWQTPEHGVLATIGAIDPGLVPTVVAADQAAHRVLVEHVVGEDCYAPGEASVQEAVHAWVAVQAQLATEAHRAQLLADGVPDLSLDTLGLRLQTRLLDPPDALPARERATVVELLVTLPARLAALAGTGLPDTVVHGDFQGGNWRAGGPGVVIMDWSDASISHPALDLVGLLASLPEARRPATLDRWAARWRAAVPGCDPYGAAALVGPLQPLQDALLYQHFLDHIEPSERCYHEGDPAAMVRLAAAHGPEQRLAR